MADKRADAWKLGAGWNETFEWYAKAILELQSRDITDRTSWRYLAAMHDFNKDDWVGLGLIEASTPLPPDDEMKAAWFQCQHGSYYFLPWHRGYLAGFEAIIAAAIEGLGGPPAWKLPYWNYLDTTNPDARKIPTAFLDPVMPDGTPNPLHNLPRYGQTEIGPIPSFGVPDISLDAMGEPDWDGTASFGGPKTPFHHVSFMGDPPAGQLESDPHGLVHVLVGGSTDLDNAGDGYLSSFLTAGLDPLFWLHHCNLDRLWEAWIARPGSKFNPDAAWYDGPRAPDRQFLIPKADGSALVRFTPRDTLEGGVLYPVYDDLTRGTGAVGAPGAATVSTKQGAGAMAEPQIVAANEERLELGAVPVDTEVRLPAQAGQAMATTMGPDKAESEAGRLFLKLENVRGSSEGGVISVYLSAQPDAAGELPFDRLAGGAALFGLSAKSDVDAGHGGNGLTFIFDITDLARRLIAEGIFDPAKLDVKVRAVHKGGAANPVTVERVTLLKS